MQQKKHPHLRYQAWNATTNFMLIVDGFVCLLETLLT